MNNIIDSFIGALDMCRDKYTYQELLMELGNKGASRVELMIIDSGLKKMPIFPLQRTLLLLPSKFEEMIQSATDKLLILNDKKEKPILN